MYITETCAEDHFQELFNHTASRLFILDVFKTCTLEVLRKYGTFINSKAAKLYVKLYDWHLIMTPISHKILVGTWYCR